MAGSDIMSEVRFARLWRKSCENFLFIFSSCSFIMNASNK